MITIRGDFAEAKIYTNELENSAEMQIKKLLDQPFISGSRIRIMPDVHAGAGCAIGTTMTIKDKVVPNLVGVDIGCGMETVKLEQTRINLPELNSLIKDRIPAGMEIRKGPHRYLGEIDLRKLRCVYSVNVDRGELSLGTLGGGNHFIEIDRDDDGALYLVVHSGSRNIGLQVAEYYQKKGYEALGGRKYDVIPYDLAYVEGRDLEDYLHDMRIMQEFAELNRQAITDEIMKGMKLTEKERFTTTHNYIDLENMILRKGAVSAREGETLLIPINMRDGSLICTGLGNPDWNESAPHGAGRIMSRTEAKKSFTVSAFKSEMTAVFSTTIGDETLDECPMAYKSMDDIVRYIAPSVRIEKHIIPIFNFKAGENIMQRRKSGNRSDHKGRNKKRR
jgi:RNA-splicing ligase RtcB